MSYDIWHTSPLTIEAEKERRARDQEFLRTREPRHSCRASGERDARDDFQPVFNRPQTPCKRVDGRRGPKGPRPHSAATALLRELAQRRSPASFATLRHCTDHGRHTHQAVYMALAYLVKTGAVAREGTAKRYRFLITLDGLERLAAVE